MQRHSRVLLVLVLVAAAVIALQVLATWRTSERVQSIVQDISSLDESKLPHEKTRGEIAQIRIRNELDRFFWQTLITSLLPLASAGVALIGAWLGLRRYLDTREKERLDRAASDLTQVLEYLASEDVRKRTVGLVGLQHFFSQDKQEYHLRALSALAAGARLETEEEVLRALRLAMEQAVANVAPGLLREVSWQGVKLSGVDLTDRRLDGLDLRDAVLEDANLSGATLTGAQLANARLNGAKLKSADLRDADLTYADLAGTGLEAADLRGASLDEARVLRMNLAGADLRGAVFDPDEFRWDLIDNWRQARFDEGLMAKLVARYGPGGAGPRVLMLLWEVPPLVAGGTWTASYHLVRNLKRSGAQVTVVVPWSEWALSPLPFDTDVPLVSMNIEPPRQPSLPGAPYWSPYSAPAWSPYAAPAWSPYGRASGGFPQSPYAGAPGYGVYGWPAGGPPGAAPYGQISAGFVYQGGSGLLRLMEIYRRRVAQLAARQGFELIHAHDWVTFPAAIEAARKTGVGWIGHFHSTEAERHPDRPDPVVVRLEREAAQGASAIVTPSRITAGRIVESYGIDEGRVHAVPNSLSPEEVPSADMGSYEARRVVFLGRLARQKGPDLFAGIAREVLKHRHDVLFIAHGEGEEAARLAASPVRVLGPVDWKARGGAFRGATALVVPSRAEPFGMVVLEAMQHRVPVLFATGCGAGEVLDSGIRIDPERPEEAAARLIPLLDDWLFWEQTVEAQTAEILEYPARGYERDLMKIWTQVHQGAPAVGAAPGAPQPA